MVLALRVIAILEALSGIFLTLYFWPVEIVSRITGGVVEPTSFQYSFAIMWSFAGILSAIFIGAFALHLETTQELKTIIASLNRTTYEIRDYLSGKPTTGDSGARRNGFGPRPFSQR